MTTKKIEDMDKFNKNQIVKSKKYMQYVDFLNGNLKDGTEYTIAEIDEMINNFYGKKGD